MSKKSNKSNNYNNTHPIKQNTTVPTTNKAEKGEDCQNKIHSKDSELSNEQIVSILSKWLPILSILAIVLVVLSNAGKISGCIHSSKKQL